MIDEQYGYLVEGWAQNQLSEAEHQQLTKLLATGELKQEDLEAYRSFSQAVSQSPAPEPTAQLRNNFYAMLADAEAQERKPGLWSSIQNWFTESHISFGQLAAAGMLLLLGLVGGYMLRPIEPYQNQISQLQTQVSDLQQTMLLSKLESQSATERLKAVNVSQELPNADQQLIEALFKTLNSDPSVNVRLAAIEVLHKHTKHAQVREGLVRSLSRQDSPLVLIALADELAAIQEKRAIEPLQELLKDKTLDRSAEQQLERTLQTLI
jgi:hypothetical protein